MEAVIDKLGDVGLIADIPGWQSPPNAFDSVQNIRMNESHIASFPGHGTYTTPTVTPYWLLPVAVDTAYYWLYLGTAAAYSYNGSTHVEITRTSTAYTGTSTTRMNGGVLNGVPVLNNGIDDPQAWHTPGSGNLADLTTWPASTTCKIMRPYKEYLVAMDVTKSGTRYPHLVKWSDAADQGSVPTSWDETDPTTDAGENALADTGGYIVDAVLLGDELVIFKEDTAYGMQWIGGQYIFNFRRINIPGMLAQSCGVQFDGGICYMGDGDVYVTDGQAATSVIDKRNKQYLFDAIDADNYTACYLAHNKAKNEIWVCYPSAGSSLSDKALVWNYKLNVWYQRNLPSATAFIANGILTSSAVTWATSADTWASVSQSWDKRTYSPVEDSLVAASDKLYQFEDGNQFGGTNPVCYAEKTGINLDGSNGINEIQQIYPMAEGGAFSVYVGSQMSPEGSVTWKGPFSFDPSTDYKIDCQVNGMYHAVKFYSNANVAWSATGYKFTYVKTGQR